MDEGKKNNGPSARPTGTGPLFSPRFGGEQKRFAVGLLRGQIELGTRLPFGLWRQRLGSPQKQARHR